MSENNSCSSSSPVRVHFSDVTNKNHVLDDDCRWKLLSGKSVRLPLVQRIFSFLAAPKITIENEENENEHDAWTEYRHLFENNRSHSLNPSSMGNNYLLRHSSANTSLSESSSLEPMSDNHDDLLSIIEQAGINFGEHERCSICHRLVALRSRSVNRLVVNGSIGEYQWLSFV